MAKEIYHRCVGDAQECETPAVCEDCGRSATPENPVLVTMDPEGDEFVCEYCKSYEGDSDALEAALVEESEAK